MKGVGVALGSKRYTVVPLELRQSPEQEPGACMCVHFSGEPRAGPAVQSYRLAMFPTAKRRKIKVPPFQFRQQEGILIRRNFR